MATFQQQLGDYEIIERIAQGGMAQIYKAKTADPNGIARLVVIKRILPHISSNPEYVEMLIDEAKIAVHFNHGNIAQIYDLGKAGDDYFIVMEYVDGKTLGQIVREFKDREEKVPLEIAVYCLMEVCRGLDYMHSRTNADGKPLGVVHRDISPQNIIMSYSGTVKIIDFGVAKAVEKSSNTESGVLKGKFAYMSPEQAQGNPIDRRSDIFAAGILLWEVITGERLFKRKSNLDTVKAVQKAQVTPPSKMRKGVPKALDKIIQKALARKPSSRYQQASEMAEDLARFLSEHYPDFRMLNVTQFLYRYFGPEPDEEGLPPEMAELAVEKKQKPPPLKNIPDPSAEEVTEVDFGDQIRSALASGKTGKIIAASLAGGGVLLLIVLVSLLFPGFNRGILNLEVIPQGATVSINGETLPEGAHSIERPANRPLKVRASLAGYHPFETEVELQKDQKKELSIVLEKVMPPFGEVYVDSNPPGAAILIDGLNSNRVTPALIARLKSGQKYKIRLQLDEYRAVEREVFIDGRTSEKINVNLEVDTATLEISSSPPGAHVIIDEQVVGNTPFVLRNIRPQESIELTLKLEGHATVRRDLTFKAGDRQTLNVDLKAGP